MREDLCHEAIRLATLLTEHPATQEPRAFALLALMLLNAARLSARTDDAGNLLRLHEQDRAAWDHAMIQRGIACLRHAAQGGTLSVYHLEASIAATHCLRLMRRRRTGRASSSFTTNFSPSPAHPSPR